MADETWAETLKVTLSLPVFLQIFVAGLSLQQ